MKKKSTRDLVIRLKQAGQDEEFYPTTRSMILAALRWIPNDANSIMDIGAGDGRVLAMFAEKCKDAKLYGRGCRHGNGLDPKGSKEIFQ